ncbi:uncharacterized protein LOC118465536 [Anopheles albimanus]|uniref:Gustatory receptor n=1 Tax=Anopheles albimanus TaxID=7167 RepID=A0A182G0B4_ANOAL|nr:uncharacterized protein LOC118465536 [Anopheles albimanus]
MAWYDTKQDKVRQLVYPTIGLTLRLSQYISLTPYPLSILQHRDRLTTGSVRTKLILAAQKILAFAITGGLVVSLFVLFFCFPRLLYESTVPIFIKILYYIVNAVQILMVANLTIGCEGKRDRYEQYLRDVFELVQQIATIEDCPQTIRNRKAIKVLLALYTILSLLLPIGLVTAMDHIGSLPLTIVYVVPYTVSFMILLQYYSVFVHLWSCLRKLNIKLTPIVRGNGYLPYNDKSVTFLNLTRKDDPTRPQLEIIEKCRMLHLQTMNIAGGVNTNFGLVIILIVVAVFASINVELLELYQYIKNGHIGPTHIVLKCLYTCFKFFFYYLIAHPNWMIQSENEQMLFLLYSIRKTACSDETNSAIEHYVSQISSLRNVHQAGGMIDLDMKLISNAVAGVTSIMVVLIQFSDSAK